MVTIWILHGYSMDTPGFPRYFPGDNLYNSHIPPIFSSCGLSAFDHYPRYLFLPPHPAA